MDIGSIFLILALLVLVGLFIGQPFFKNKEVPLTALTDAQEHEFSALMAERDRVLNALQELDFDYGLGKIPEEDYPDQRAALLQHGADVLRKLDHFQAGPSDEDVEARIEAVIAARRADARRISTSAGREPEAKDTVVQLAEPDDDLEVLLANRRRERQEKSAGFCPQCGGAVRKSDRFCPKCGNTLG